MPEKPSNIECFHQFCDSPTEFNKDIISGSISHIQKIIQGQEASPKRAVFVDIFNHFVTHEVKDYVYARMKKSLLEELALKLLKEIQAEGPQCMKTLEIQIEKTSAGGKQLIIPGDDKSFAIKEGDEQLLIEQIDSVEGTLVDKSGDSPNVKFAVIVREKLSRGANAKAQKSLAKFFDKVCTHP